MSASPAESIEMFTSVTGASREIAEQHLQATRGDVQQAILNFIEGAGDAADDAPAAQANPPVAPSSGPGDIESIMGLARDQGAEDSQDSSKGSGSKGAGKGGPDDPQQKIIVVFFEDGFMVEDKAENLEEEEEKETPAEAPKPPARRIGMMSLDDLPREPRGGMPKLPKKIPKLAPLRSYDTPEGKEFIADIKAGKVPKEFQKRDEKGRPVGTSIAVSDERPKTYSEINEMLEKMRQMKAQQEGEQKKSAPAATAMFTGAGHTLSSSSAASAAPGGSTGSCDPTLLALVHAAAAPVVDESKPATTLQLRLSTGARVKARLNLDHTVADLWRLVAKELGPAFATTSGQELSAGFPPKTLTDTSATLAAADLANASVTHKCR